MLPLADGSDLGGSLRNPASFCNVLGLRPSPGRVPLSGRGWRHARLHGPMARSVDDIALFLSVMAGPDARDPLFARGAGRRVRAAAGARLPGVRIAWSERLGGIRWIRRDRRSATRAAQVFADLGCESSTRDPDFARRRRHLSNAARRGHAVVLGRDLERHRALLKDTVVWNVERGLALTPGDVAARAQEKAALERRVDGFLEPTNFCCCPVPRCCRSPSRSSGCSEIGPVPRMATYIDWMATCYAVSCTGLPAISVPCGFAPGGLPVGLQIVGRRGRDRDVLALAYAFERETRFAERRPALVERVGGEGGAGGGGGGVVGGGAGGGGGGAGVGGLGGRRGAAVEALSLRGRGVRVEEVWGGGVVGGGGGGGWGGGFKRGTFEGTVLSRPEDFEVLGGCSGVLGGGGRG